MRCGRHEEGDGHDASPRHEEEVRAGGGADEGDADEVSPSWALTSILIKRQGVLAAHRGSICRRPHAGLFAGSRCVRRSA